MLNVYILYFFCQNIGDVNLVHIIMKKISALFQVHLCPGLGK